MSEEQHLEKKAAEKAAKPRMELVPMDAIREIARVMTFGAKKYAVDSWKREPFTRDMYKGAMLRHLAEIDAGNCVDDETGLLHVWHLACDAMMYAWHFAKDYARGDLTPKD